ncbi:MAG: SEC-C domain-containing protein [Halanaerobiales bacterium]|nr:SEC-C domain-containing protein [Halanaerobiales bacterium]
MKFANMYEEEVLTPIRKYKVGRNDPCPCGSSKKYKKCCAQIQPKNSLEYYYEKMENETNYENLHKIFLEAENEYPLEPNFILPLGIYYLQNNLIDKAEYYFKKA